MTPRRLVARARASGSSLLVAVGVLLVAELGVRALAGPLHEPMVWRDRETSAKAAQIAGLGDAGGAEVVLVGSSMTNAAVDPVALTEALGTSRPAYNAALNGASTPTLATWVEEVVIPQLRPDLIVVGLSSRELNGRGRNQDEELTSFSSSPAVERLTGGGGWSGRIERALEDASALVRYRTTLRRPLEAFDDTKGPPRPRDMLQPLGVLRALRVFASADYRVTADFRARMVDRVFNDYEIGTREVAALHELYEIAERADVDVAVVLMPITEDAVTMHPNGADDLARFEAAIADATEGRRVLDLRSGFQDLRLFADPLHLNGQGRADFTTALAEALR